MQHTNTCASRALITCLLGLLASTACSFDSIGEAEGLSETDGETGDGTEGTDSSDAGTEGSTSNGSTSGDGDGDTDGCTPGYEGCECVDGDTCLDGLECLSGLCVDPNSGETEGETDGGEPVCGNGIREGDEECDGFDGVSQCENLGLDGFFGLDCHEDCTFDISACFDPAGVPDDGSQWSPCDTSDPLYCGNNPVPFDEADTCQFHQEGDDVGFCTKSCEHTSECGAAPGGGTAHTFCGIPNGGNVGHCMLDCSDGKICPGNMQCVIDPNYGTVCT